MVGLLQHLRWLFTVIAVLCSPALQSAPYALDNTTEVNLHGHLYFLEDVSGQLALDQLEREELAWQKNSEQTFSHGYQDSAWWFRLQLKNPSAEKQQRMLELGYAILDYVDIYVIRDNQLLKSYLTGDRRAFNTRPIDSENFVVPITWQPGETLVVYYRIKTGSALQVPVKLWQPASYYSEENKSNIVHGTFYGGMLIIAVYNLLIFLLLWDRSYLYYAFFIFSSPLFFLSISGQGYRYLWTDYTDWNSISLPISVASLLFFGAMFTREFIGLKNVSMKLDRIVLCSAIFGGIMLVLSVFLPYKTAILILIPIGAFACLFDLVAGSIAWYRGVESARFYVIAWSCFLIANIAMNLQKIGWIPKSFVIEYGVQFGSVLEAILLSFALAERINMERRLRFAAQTETIDTARRLNKELEQRVEERTAALEAANKKLQILSNTDQLTQIYNRRYLDQVLSKEWARCGRYQHHMAVLLIDVDHFKEVNDQYGHQVGDACLIEVARTLQSGLRVPSDVVARFGGEEFCVLLPETDPAGAAVVAERMREIIQQQLVTVDNLFVRITISIGVCSLIPNPNSSVDDMLGCADKALYLAKYSGRNRVTFYNSENPVIPIKQKRE